MPKHHTLKKASLNLVPNSGSLLVGRVIWSFSHIAGSLLCSLENAREL